MQIDTVPPMFFAASKSRAVSLQWVILLSLAIFFAQGIRLHIHSFDHDQAGEHHLLDDLAGHETITKAHSFSDQSHADHHDEVMSEIEISPNTLFKTNSYIPPILTLISVFLALVGVATSPYRFRKFPDDDTKFSDRCYLSPPLRAPPL